MRLFRRRIARDQEGAALLEGAVVFPFLFVLSFGVFEFSNIFFQHHIITTGVRDAARFAARVDDPQAFETQIRNLAVRGTIDETGALRLNWWNPGADQFDVSVDVIPNPEVDGNRLYRGGATIAVVEVSAEVNYPVLGFFGFLGIDGVTMTIAHQERVIGG